MPDAFQEIIVTPIEIQPLRAAKEGTPVITARHRVPAAEVDSFHVVHFSKYLGWFSAAMVAAFEERGLGPGRFDEGKVEIRVARAQAAYLKSARLDDLVEIDIQRIEPRANGLLVVAQARVGTSLLARARLTIACVNPVNGELVRLPHEVRQAFAPDQAEAA